MADTEPNFAQVLTQIQESLRTMKHYVITYRLQLLRLSLRKPDRITDTPEESEREMSAAGLHQTKDSRHSKGRRFA